MAADESVIVANEEARETWSSRTAFTLAAIGAAVGLGNIWRFPTLAGENGGGAFVLFYFGCVLLIGLPLVLSEILIGRAGRQDAVGSVAVLADKSGVSRNWSGLGGIEVLAAFLILSFYSVVAGWATYYVGVLVQDFFGNLMSGSFLASALVGETQDQITGRMGDLFSRPGLLIGMHTIFMAITVFIVANGIQGGIEKAAKYLMPAFFLLLILLTIYGAFNGEFEKALRFLFTPDFSKLTPPIMNAALGQALFSMSLGSAALITYGAYVSDKTRLAPTATVIAFADTGVAIVAGLMIFPIVFAVGLDPSSGPTLVFQSLPVAFNQMPAGSLIGLAFFVLIFFAALTSSISLLMGPVAWAKLRFDVSHLTSTLILGFLAWLIGVACALGYNVWSDVRPLSFWGVFETADILDSVDGFTGKVLLPLAAFFVSVFIGWRADRALVDAQTGINGPLLSIWRFLLAWVAPIAVGLIIIFGLFPEILGTA